MILKYLSDSYSILLIDLDSIDLGYSGNLFQSDVVNNWRVVFNNLGELSVKDVQFSDAGDYICQARSGTMSPMQKEISLIVKGMY